MADLQLLMADFQLSMADFQLLMADFQLLMADFQLSLSLDRLHEWGTRKVRFEPTKSQLIHFTRRTEPWPVPPESFGGHLLEPDQEVKLLGVTFDSKTAF